MGNEQIAILLSKGTPCSIVKRDSLDPRSCNGQLEIYVVHQVINFIRRKLRGIKIIGLTSISQLQPCLCNSITQDVLSDLIQR